MRVVLSLSALLSLSLLAGCGEAHTAVDARAGSDAASADASTPGVDASTPGTDASMPDVDASMMVDAGTVDAGGGVDAAAMDAGPADLTPMAVCSRVCAALIACVSPGMEPEMCVESCTTDLGDCSAAQLAQISACEDDGCAMSMMEPPPIVTCVMGVACVGGE